MALQRRQFLHLLGAAAGGLSLPSRANSARQQALLPFKPVRTPLPLPTDGLSLQKQRQAYRVVRINDALSLPEGYEQQLLASWGDQIGRAHV